MTSDENAYDGFYRIGEKFTEESHHPELVEGLVALDGLDQQITFSP